MGSPIKAADIDVTNYSGDSCTQLKQFLATTEKIKTLLAWLFDANGNATQAFKDLFLSETVPVGSITFMPVSTVPEGWLIANGQIVSRTTYSRLFTRIGTYFGVGDGSTTFGLPDAQGRFLFGQDGAHPLMSTGGETDHLLTRAELPDEELTIDMDTGNGITNIGSKRVLCAGVVPEYAIGTSAEHYLQGMVPIENFTTEALGSGGTHNNMPPYLAGLWLIKY